MIYTPLTRKAIHIAYDAHKDTLDDFGIPYVFHPYHLAESMDDEYSTCTALLHDVVEDTDYTIEQLSEIFPKEVIDAVKLLTHNDDTPYLDYVRRIKTNPIATKVKLADLTHNSDLSRLDNVSENDLLRTEKYKKAKEILLEKVL